MRHLMLRSATTFAPMLVALATSMAYGQSPNGDLKDASIDELKSAYLSCSGAAVSGRLNTGGITQCSVVYEELKQRAFGGDFAKLLDWSKAHPPEPNGEGSTRATEPWPDSDRL